MSLIPSAQGESNSQFLKEDCDHQASKKIKISASLCEPLVIKSTTIFSNRMQRNTELKPGVANPAVKRKMVIKPFKKKPQLPENFEQDTWAKLKDAIVAVQENKPVSFSHEELYRSVEDLCTWKMSERLYQRLYEACASHISTAVQNLVNTTPDHTAFLSLVDAVWQDHCNHMLTIRSIFLYLDRTYVLQTNSIRSIWEMGLYLFRGNIKERPDVQNKLIKGLLALVENERQGEAINRSLMHSLLRMLSALQIYEEKFEAPFLEATSVFYTAEGERFMDQTDVPHFLQHVESRLHEESERLVHYLEPCTRKPLLVTVEQHLLKPHTARVLEKGFDVLMDGDRQEDVRCMYSLLSRVNALDELKNYLNGYVRRKVKEIVEDQERDKEMVEQLLSFRSKLDAFLENSFQSNSTYIYSIKEAFETAINIRRNRPAELVAKFVDSKLRSGNKGGTEEEIEALLDRVMIIFRYLQSKDVFEAFYKKDLAKRLLLGKSASFDMEKSMISKLKTECGNSFTNKLEGMFKDIDLSRDVMTQFQQHAPQRQAVESLGKSLDMYVQVLTTGYWPAYPPMEIHMPKELATYQSIFDNFYLAKYQGRRLLWQHSLGHCVLKANFPKGKKELSVSLFQTLCLLCFNTVNKISFKELKEQTKIEDGELRRTLQSLTCGKVRVLHKQPKGREVEDDDCFVFNSDFTNKLIRIKINSIQMKETVEENNDTHERVFRDRQYQVDAAVVRIMKARKTLSHTLLMSELFGQLRFPAKPADIKKRIESLIDREYLERDENNPQVYNYLA